MGSLMKCALRCWLMDDGISVVTNSWTIEV